MATRFVALPAEGRDVAMVPSRVELWSQEERLDDFSYTYIADWLCH